MAKSFKDINFSELSPLGLEAIQYINAPYKYGANGPFLFDCSGFVLKVLHGVGHTLADRTSQSIYDWHVKYSDMTREPSRDCLLYYGRGVRSITHIAIALSDRLLIEAGGAGSETMEMGLEKLLEWCGPRDARVRIKPIGHRRDLVASMPLLYKKL
jgi:cell wall-associated NlpC family hydrolase